MHFEKILLAAVVGSLLLTSCVSNKQLRDRSVYFNNISDSVLAKTSIEYEPVFQKGDILSVSVITTNEMSSRLFNLPGAASGASGAEGGASISASPGGYLINEKGNIIFPYLGVIRAAGLTRTSLTDTISSKLKQYIDSGIVSIRLLNYRITVLGEVTRPGTFSIPSERVTLLDAIGLAGDLTIYGKRENIRIIRTADGRRQTATLNLNSGDIFDSPYFFLRQNDVVYVELNERKIANTDQTSLRNLSMGLGIISALGVIISTINILR